MGQRGLNALPRVGEASLGRKGTEPHLKGLLSSPAGPPGLPAPHSLPLRLELRSPTATITLEAETSWKPLWTGRAHRASIL